MGYLSWAKLWESFVITPSWLIVTVTSLFIFTILVRTQVLNSAEVSPDFGSGEHPEGMVYSIPLITPAESRGLLLIRPSPQDCDEIFQCCYSPIPNSLACESHCCGIDCCLVPKKAVVRTI